MVIYLLYLFHFWQISETASISKKLLLPKQSTRCITQSSTWNSPISSCYRSANCFIGSSPDSDVTVPLPARYVVDQARSIRLQISNPLHQRCHAAVADQILSDEIVRLEEQRHLLNHCRDITLLQEDINLLRAALIQDWPVDFVLYVSHFKTYNISFIQCR